jgi:hypothetical protein
MKNRETWDDRYGLLNHPYLHYGVVSVTSGPYNAGVDGPECVILVDTGGVNFTVNLPPASTNPGKAFYVKKINALGGFVKLQASAGDTVDGAVSNSTITAQFDALLVVSDGGTGWWIIGEAGPSF